MLVAACGLAAGESPLFQRGYAVLPAPQEVVLESREIEFGSAWRIVRGAGVETGDVALEALKEGLRRRHRIEPGEGAAAGAPAVVLEIRPGSVQIGRALDRDRQVLAEQAYRIELQPDSVRITANAPPGLFYGAGTLVQLLKRSAGKLLLPAGRIVDWPDLQLRLIYWDNAHHLERMDAFKRAIREAAFYKVNAIALKLEGHFEFRSAPALVEPYALSPAQLQELTDYGLRYHLQLIPWVDAPAHVAFILKHPEYAHLRAYPDSNYEFCVANPGTIELLAGMYDDLIRANQGVSYIYLSTDEPYYVGLADNPLCREAARTRELGSQGKVLAEFVAKIAEPLRRQGRKVVFMGERPVQPGDIPSFPPYLINTVVGGPAVDPVYKAHGIRQMLHSSTQGEEPLFPKYYVLPDADLLHTPGRREKPRVEDGYETISSYTAREQGDILGVINAGWGDAGLHTETFWLGYAAITAAGWRPAEPGPAETMRSFYRLFYGPGATQIERLYQLMSYQAQFWGDSWEVKPSTHRKPIFGSSRRIHKPKVPAEDFTLDLPAAPAGDLAYEAGWSAANSERIRLAGKYKAQNDELKALLAANLPSAEVNRYNLEVYGTIAALCRYNLDFLEGLGEIDRMLAEAGSAARGGRAKDALRAVDGALERVRRLRDERNRVYKETVRVWYRSWHPRVPAANGRRYWHELDDVKDHEPDRTVDMTYLIYRDLNLPLGKWFEEVQAVRNRYAEAHSQPLHETPFAWTSLVSDEESEGKDE